MKKKIKEECQEVLSRVLVLSLLKVANVTRLKHLKERKKEKEEAEGLYTVLSGRPNHQDKKASVCCGLCLSHYQRTKAVGGSRMRVVERVRKVDG